MFSCCIKKIIKDEEKEELTPIQNIDILINRKRKELISLDCPNLEPIRPIKIIKDDNRKRKELISLNCPNLEPIRPDWSVSSITI
jgi:hypothetical protein